MTRQGLRVGSAQGARVGASGSAATGGGVAAATFASGVSQSAVLPVLTPLPAACFPDDGLVAGLLDAALAGADFAGFDFPFAGLAVAVVAVLPAGVGAGAAAGRGGTWAVGVVVDV